MTASPSKPTRKSLLHSQLAWFMGLRWAAGGVVLGFGVADHFLLHCYGHGLAMAVLGACILLYNAMLWRLLARAGERRAARWVTLTIAGGQLLLDLLALALLTLWTGGAASPLRGFFNWHMVFAALLLPRALAFGGAAVAVLLLEATLAASSHGTFDRTVLLAGIARAVMLFGTVYLASHISGKLRIKQRRLARQNRRIRAMSLRLQRQQQAILQQEKLAAMGQMAAGVAHEIANPLASMDGLLQLMERKPERLRPESVATLREQVSRINGIVRQMTTFAHSGEGQWESETLNQVVERALAILRFDPRFKKVALELDLAQGIPELRLLAGAMEQVIVNLVVNALDALDGHEAPRITVRTESDSEACKLVLSDNGPGISPEHIKRLFEPFFTTKPVGKGTGLGLSISYTLVRKHGGEIAVHSEPGQGARFTVTLPRAGASRNREELGAGLFKT